VSRLKTSLPESLATPVKATIADGQSRDTMQHWWQVPGQKYGFGIGKAAQARGDFQGLAERGRRALRVHRGSNLKAGLGTLQAAVQKAL
jgi:hypothetical protein